MGERRVAEKGGARLRLRLRLRRASVAGSRPRLGVLSASLDMWRLNFILLEL
jgi:hypothetical protein